MRYINIKHFHFHLLKWRLFRCFWPPSRQICWLHYHAPVLHEVFPDCGFSKHIYSSMWHPQTSELNVKFSMFEQTLRLLPTFKAWLLSTRSFCFNGEEIPTCLEVTKTILSQRCCKFKRKGRYNKWIFAFCVKDGNKFCVGVLKPWLFVLVCL